MGYRNDIEVYLTEGFCPEFYAGLEAFTRRLYFRYGVDEAQCPYDVFHENVVAKVEDVLSVGAYDPRRSNFKSFIFGMIRNEATKIISKNKKRAFIDVMSYLDNPPECFTPTGPDPRQLFLSQAEELLVPIDENKFQADLKEGLTSPEVLAYLWKCREGSVHGSACI